MSNIEMGAIVLQYVGQVAAWHRTNPETGELRWQPMVVIQCCGGNGDHGYEPPQSISLSGKEALLALKQAIDEAIKYEI